MGEKCSQNALIMSLATRILIVLSPFLLCLYYITGSWICQAFLFFPANNFFICQLVGGIPLVNLAGLNARDADTVAIESPNFHFLFLRISFCGSGPHTTSVATAGLGGTLLAHLLTIVYTMNRENSSWNIAQNNRRFYLPICAF